jgi:hypothetical protein
MARVLSGPAYYDPYMDDNSGGTPVTAAYLDSIGIDPSTGNTYGGSGDPIVSVTHQKVFVPNSAAPSPGTPAQPFNLTAFLQKYSTAIYAAAGALFVMAVMTRPSR